MMVEINSSHSSFPYRKLNVSAKMLKLTKKQLAPILGLEAKGLVRLLLDLVDLLRHS